MPDQSDHPSRERRQYFSERHGRGPKSEPLTIKGLKRLVFSVWDDFFARDYFQEAFGYACVDAGVVDGDIGADKNAYFLRALGRDDVWPYRDVPAFVDPYDQDTCFDMAEALHDLVSKPLPRPNSVDYHGFSDCGWHYVNFSRSEGQREYRAELNEVLRRCNPPHEMDGMGQVIERGPEEFHTLLSAPVPPGTEHDVITARVDAAVKRYRTRGASIEERHHAVRDLADVLEALREDMKSVMLPKDESELFHIANGFAIRHNNRRQRRDYDQAVWLAWAFYVYLATIHAVLRVRNR